MAKSRCVPFLLVLIGMVLLTGCGGTFDVRLVETPDRTTRPAVDIDATVAAAVAATMTAGVRSNPRATGTPTFPTTLVAESIAAANATVAAAIAVTLAAAPITSPSTPTTVYFTATPSPTNTPTPSPTPSPTPCGLQPHPALMDAWNRGRLGCAQDGAVMVWAAWEPFERGYMLWRSDSYDVHILYYQDGTNPSAGSWGLWYLDWDGSNPGGIGLAPPQGRLEPVRGFGWVWREHLDGPDGPLGWALEPEKGFCARVQTFESGIIVGSTQDPSCDGQQPGDASDPTLAPFLCALYGYWTWECQ
jgi:hypothetical protein